MLKIIAISCSKIANPELLRKKVTHSLIGTFRADKEIIELCNKKRPTLLFIPTASMDSANYIECISKYFKKLFHCEIRVLCLTKKTYSPKEISKEILGADIIYVGGGNTLKMMRIWKKYGVDKILNLAARKGIVMAGVSAGGICWFRSGNSDSKRVEHKPAGLIKVKGLGLIKAVFSPHYSSDKGRKIHLKKIMKTEPGVAIAADDYCAIEVIGNKFKIIRPNKKSNIYKVYWKNKKFHHEKVTNENKYLPLETLLKK